MSDQFTYIALVLHSGDIQLVDLHSYCTTSPQVLQQGRQSQLSSSHSYLHTCQYGDIPWREKLLFMHSDHKSNPVQASQPQVVNVPKRKQYKQTGFRTSRRQKGGSIQEYVSVIRTADSVHGYCVYDIYIDEKMIYIVYCYNNTYVMCQIELSTHKWNMFR